MTSPIEKVLFEQLRDTFIAVHKSQELNKEMGTWDRNILKVGEDEIEKVCIQIARNVTVFVEGEKRNGRSPTTTQIKNKIGEELNNL